LLGDGNTDPFGAFPVGVANPDRCTNDEVGLDCESFPFLRGCAMADETLDNSSTCMGIISLKWRRSFPGWRTFGPSSNVTKLVIRDDHIRLPMAERTTIFGFTYHNETQTV